MSSFYYTMICAVILAVVSGIQGISVTKEFVKYAMLNFIPLAMIGFYPMIVKK